MTATDPRPALAAMPAERLTPPPPENDRALAGHHRAGRAVRGDGQGPCGCAGPQTEGKSHTNGVGL